MPSGQQHCTLEPLKLKCVQQKVMDIILPCRACRSGSPCDPECPADEHKLSAAATHYLLIDTNVALHQVWIQRGCMPDDDDVPAAGTCTSLRA